jgi:hypothetical protein
MSDNESIIDIDPTPEKRPVLPGGKYGEAGEATLESIKADTVKYGRDAGKPCINTRVSILTSEYGYVSQFTDWALEGPRKNFTLKMLTNLGLDLNAMKGEDGRVRFDGSSLNGTKVIVDLHYREYDMKDGEGNVTGERGQANDVRMLWRRA